MYLRMYTYLKSSVVLHRPDQSLNITDQAFESEVFIPKYCSDVRRHILQYSMPGGSVLSSVTIQRLQD